MEAAMMYPGHPLCPPTWPKNTWVNLQFSIMSSALCATVEISSWLLGSLGCGSNISGTIGEKSIFSCTQLAQLDVEAASNSWMALQSKPRWPICVLLISPVSLFFFFPMHYTQVWSCCSEVAKRHSCLKPSVTCPPCPFLPSSSTLQSLQHY